jgi:nicotinate-nucleotide--dimethylbenzimidazole phosphoribosyltransferase
MTDSWWLKPAQALNVPMREAALARQQQLTKPTGSLGQLERVAVQLAGLQGREKPAVDKCWIAIFAGDHGVVAEGVSAYPQEVTGQMLHNFIMGGAAISVLAKQLSAQLDVVDLGTVSPLNLPGVRHLNIGAGTANFAQGPAMTVEQGLLAMAGGRDSVLRAKAAGSELFIGGEMGIGNTASASAVACSLLECAAPLLVGPGTGLNAEGIRHKTAVIERALALHAEQAAGDPLQSLLCLGGFEIAALVGAYLACAQEGIAALVDGFICSVAALVAVRLNPSCREWLLFGHRGAEPGHRHLLETLQAEPLIDLGLRLGEGSGAALAVPLVQMACALHNNMATFAEAAVADRPA